MCSRLRSGDHVKIVNEAKVHPHPRFCGFFLNPSSVDLKASFFSIKRDFCFKIRRKIRSKSKVHEWHNAYCFHSAAGIDPRSSSTNQCPAFKTKATMQKHGQTKQGLLGNTVNTSSPNTWLNTSVYLSSIYSRAQVLEPLLLPSQSPAAGTMRFWMDWFLLPLQLCANDVLPPPLPPSFSLKCPFSCSTSYSSFFLVPGPQRWKQREPRDEAEQHNLAVAPVNEGVLLSAPQPLQSTFHRDEAEDEPRGGKKTQDLCQDTSSARC